MVSSGQYVHHGKSGSKSHVTEAIETCCDWLMHRMGTDAPVRLAIIHSRYSVVCTEYRVVGFESVVVVQSGTPCGVLPVQDSHVGHVDSFNHGEKRRSFTDNVHGQVSGG